MRKPEISVPICPRCGSTDISPEMSADIVFAGFNRIRCNNCGYVGPFFLKMATAKPKLSRKS